MRIQEMPLKLIDIVDIGVLRDLFESFSQATGTVAAVLDLEGNVLVATGWRDICTQFHRRNPGTACRCLESDTRLAGQPKAGERYTVYRCENGLVDAAVPIVVAGRHVGNLFTGQFLLSPPDEAYFKRQAAEFGFDEGAYLAALARVPVFTDHQVETTMAFLCRLAVAIGEMGVARLRSNRELAQRNRAENALVASERQKRLIIETVPDLVWLKDIEGKYLACNRMFERLYGATEAEILGKTDYDFVDRETADFFRRHDKAAMDADRPLQNEEWLTFADDGHRALCETTKTPLKDNDGVVLGVLGVSRDITERRLAEEALRHAQKMEAVGQLTGGLAHDLNNMLSIISMSVGILDQKTAGMPDLARYIDAALNGVKRAAGLTRKLLDFSRTEADETLRVSVNEFVCGMENLIAKTLTPAITLQTDLAEDAWLVDIDPGDLEHAILNLALNARDAMPDGGVLVIETANKVIDEHYVRRNPGSSAGEYVMIAISDSGIGMPPEIAGKAFEPFFTTKEVGKGTGLGLSMVYAFVRRSGGHAKIYSEPGQGTAVHLYLPRARDAAQCADVRPSPQTDLVGGDETILVVEDEEYLLAAAVLFLGSLGYRTLTAGTGKEAMEILRRDPSIDLLFSDVIMPGGMDGYHLAIQASRERPALKILLTSGFPRRREEIANGERQAVADLGGSMLRKPYTIVDLAGAVRSALDRPG
jgi:PAS domain S-box-containing protein